MNLNDVVRRRTLKNWIAAAVLCFIAGLLCACTIGNVPVTPLPSTQTDDTTATDVKPPVSPVKWTVPRDECAHTAEPELYASCAATCVADGYEMLRCPLCGQITITVTPALGHAFAYNASGFLMDATQTDSLYRCCTREGCGVSYLVTDNLPAPDVVYALPHDGTDAVTVILDDSCNTLAAIKERCVVVPSGNYVWGYGQLEPAQRRFYADAMDILLNFAETNETLPASGEDAVCLSLAYLTYGLNETQARTALQYLIDDSPMLFWLDETIVIHDAFASLYVCEAYRDPAVRKAAAVQVECALQAICGDIDVYRNRMEGAQDFDVAIAAYRAVKSALTFSKDAGPIGITAACVVAGKSSCTGYARLLTCVMNRISIPCLTVRGTEETDAWNMLQLGGEWYGANAAADDGLDVDWMRRFGTDETADFVRNVSSSSYPLPPFASVAVGPVTLSTQNGIVGRFISPTAAFQAMTDVNGRYVLTPDADLIVVDSNTQYFSWNYTLPGGNWPKVTSLTISGAKTLDGAYGVTHLWMKINGNPVISSPVTFRDVKPGAAGMLILIGSSLSFTGENATLDLTIGGDETSTVSFDYSGRFVYAGRCQVGTVSFSGTSPVIEGIIRCSSLRVGRQTNLELRGAYSVNARSLFVNENGALVLTDKLYGAGALTIGAVTQTTEELVIKARVLQADHYPEIIFEEQVSVPTNFIVEGTSAMPSAILPGQFDGVLYTLAGGPPENWTLTVAGANVTNQTTRDSEGNYRFTAIN